jgi:hypothetical protein
MSSNHLKSYGHRISTSNSEGNNNSKTSPSKRLSKRQKTGNLSKQTMNVIATASPVKDIRVSQHTVPRPSLTPNRGASKKPASKKTPSAKRQTIQTSRWCDDPKASQCDNIWCGYPNVSEEYDSLQKKIIEHTHIVVVGPAGFKPIHNGHITVIEEAFKMANEIKNKDGARKVLVLINTSCTGRNKKAVGHTKNNPTPYVVNRAATFDLWDEYYKPILEKLKMNPPKPDIINDSNHTGGTIEYAVSFNNASTLFWMANLIAQKDKEQIDIEHQPWRGGDNIYCIFSNESDGSHMKELQRIFGKFIYTNGKEYTKYVAGETLHGTFGRVHVKDIGRADDSESGTKARKLLTTDIDSFMKMTNKIDTSRNYALSLLSHKTAKPFNLGAGASASAGAGASAGGSRKQRTKRKYNSVKRK